MSDGFRINKAYAEKYNTWRQKEELQKLKDKYGDEEDSEESTSSESEDEDAEALTDQLEKDWLRTLSALKSKDPKIYQKDVKFYKDESSISSGESDSKMGKKSKDKPMFLKDYERKVILEKGGVVSDEEEDSEGERPSHSLAYHQEQEQLRKSFIAAAGTEGNDSDSDAENSKLLKKREKTAAEREKEEFEYLEWLKGQKESLEEEKQIGTELEPLKKFWQNKNLDEGEKFLRNYILNRQYIDKDDESMPTYDEIVQDEDKDFSEDEELLTKQENFERKYNFRFEEPDAAEVKTFPRNFEDTVRKKDTRRAEKRQEVAERKKQEKEKKKEELKQLKNLKRQEIMDKIEKLKEITGNKKLGFDELDLDEDFDPSKHDQMMQKCFDDEYYGENEEVKPVFEMSDEEDENWDNWTGEGGGYSGDMQNEEGADNYEDWNEGPSAEDPDFIMDADYDPVADMERKKKKKEKKKKNKLAQVLTTKKPIFDPNEKTFEEYFDEYYKLDYEDIIDDMPCRFKYRKVTPNSYGLSVDEILRCRDKELNAWASIKKMSQYRTEDEEERDIRAYTAKGRNERKKKNILTSLFESDEKEDMETPIKTQETSGENPSKKKKKKRRGKKKQKDSIRMGNNSVSTDSDDMEVAKTAEALESVISGHNKIEGKHKRSVDSKQNEVSEELTTKKRKVVGNSATSTMIMENVQQERKKKKHKKGDMKEIDISSSKDIVDSASEECQLEHRNIGEGKSEDLSADQNVMLTIKSNITESNTEHTDTKRVKVEDKNSEKRKKKKKNKNKKKGQKLQLSEERLKAYGINPKKYKYMKKEELFQIKPRNLNKKDAKSSDEIR